MAKNQSSKLHSRQARRALKLAPNDRPKVYWYHAITRGLTLGYRRCKGEGAWIVRIIKDGEQTVKPLGAADDERTADGEHVLSWDQARDKAHGFLRPASPGASTATPSLLTVGDIIDKYQEHLEDQGTSTRFAIGVRNHLAAHVPALLLTPMQLVAVKTLTDMRTALRKHAGPKGKGMSKANYDRSIAKPLKAAMKHSAPEYKSVWGPGLELYGGNSVARNVILSHEDVQKFVNGGYRHSFEIGLFIHVMEVTGNRPSQFERLLIEDFIDGDKPFVMMPKSPKGGGKAAARAERANQKFPLPITKLLALQLRKAAGGRAGHEYLLLRGDGKPWAETDRGSAFDNTIKGIVKAAGLTHPLWPVTLYALRHTSIVRQLTAKDPLPALVVAENHNTSVTEITRHYAKYITSVTQDLTRGALRELVLQAA